MNPPSDWTKKRHTVATATEEMKNGMRLRARNQRAQPGMLCSVSAKTKIIVRHSALRKSGRENRST